MRDYNDLRHAQRAVDIYLAERAMLREDGVKAGHRAYWSTLEAASSESTLGDARQAWDESLAKSGDLHAEAEAQDPEPTLDADPHETLI